VLSSKNDSYITLFGQYRIPAVQF